MTFSKLGLQNLINMKKDTYEERTNIIMQEDCCLSRSGTRQWCLFLPLLLNTAQEGLFKEIRQGNKGYSDKKKNKLFHLQMTFYIYKILKKFTKMDKKKQEIRSVCVFLKGRNWGVSVGWFGVSFGTDENVLELDIGRWHSDKESACQFLTYGRCGFDPWVGKIPWRRAWQPTPGFSPGKS